ncbi:MAG: recombinase family protein [Cyanomargarita calcarea GSE-NOS-MK-12-04C]|uniref:Recombinase family protein n=1 Tax=Cyanomargarita calcarea GSE-NOS-MK-12-04C TaxID=2839659 RepID=A0A951QPU3_9CYAN|nr:recombinase family protein [Cyanomargarita calcarea GSE-NOS-MK-12-04C]
MVSNSLWIVGPSRSGKTNCLVEQFCNWVQSKNSGYELFYTRKPDKKSSVGTPKGFTLNQAEPGVLVFAANDDNRRELVDRIVTATQGKYPVRGKTPLGFFQDEVILFWPLLIESLKLKAQFPVRLRPETEQELATKLWRPRLNEEVLRGLGGVNESRGVRRILDLLQLAAMSGTPVEDIARVLTTALPQQDDSTNLEPEFLASLLLDWRNWCLERGLLTYGIIIELWSQHLLTHPNYLSHLAKRYQAVLADDVGDYPTVARYLFDFLLEGGGMGAFSYNPDGIVRLGLGADPNYLEGLSERCQVVTLTAPPLLSLADTLTASMVQLIAQPMQEALPTSVQSIQTTSRAQLLRQTAELIASAINEGLVEADQVAVIAPGLDAIARYTLIEILSKQNIKVESLNDQRPLISSPIIRALLTVLALVYPGLGRLVDRDAVAEMLVVLSRGMAEGETASNSAHHPIIDPVRAGLIADYCFSPHPERPNLLPVTAFDRWDRLGYSATTAYGEILKWLEKQRSQQEQYLIPSPISLLYLAIQDFLCKDINPPYEQLAVLRELLETAQHYWQIDTRLRQSISVGEGQGGNQTPSSTPAGKQATLLTPHSKLSNTIAEFIQLLRRGTITANPYPVRPVGLASSSVTLATIFQYRSSRRSHRWHFWLDAGSSLWAKGGAATLFGAPFFLQHRFGQPWTAEDENLADEQRLRWILADLLGRVSQKIYLCHSELAVNGQEQLGPLLPLVNACVLVQAKAYGVEG